MFGARLKVEGIWVYPLKGGRAMPLARAALTERGIEGDRRLMVVRPSGMFCSQRSHPRLGHPHVDANDASWSFSAPELGTVDVAFEPRGDAIDVQVWGDRVRAVRCGAEADEFFSQLLGEAVHLVWMPDDAERRNDGAEPRVGFADANSYLLTNRASLEALDARIDGPAVPMLAFRPNIVVSGAPAWSEDDWSSVSIGPARLRVVSDCERCSVTTLDPADPARPRPDGEPLRTLAAFRRNERGKVVFGRYAVLEGGDCTISVGDQVTAE